MVTYEELLKLEILMDDRKAATNKQGEQKDSWVMKTMEQISLFFYFCLISHNDYIKSDMSWR